MYNLCKTVSKMTSGKVICDILKRCFRTQSVFGLNFYLTRFCSLRFSQDQKCMTMERFRNSLIITVFRFRIAASKSCQVSVSCHFCR